MATIARNLKQVNKAIQKVYPDVLLVKGDGYFYITSDNKELATDIAGFFTTSIYVYKLADISVDRWIEEVGYLMKQKDEV